MSNYKHVPWLDQLAVHWASQGGCVSKLGVTMSLAAQCLWLTMSLGAQCDILPAVNQKHVPILVKSRVCFRLRGQCDYVFGCPVCLWVQQRVLQCVAQTQQWQRSHLQAAHSPQEDQRQREEGGGADRATGQGVLT